jgi:hypothetical protein
VSFLDTPPPHVIPMNSQGTSFCDSPPLAEALILVSFDRNKYSLRPFLMGRHTELFIVMTMYNEDEVLFVKTMNASVHFTLDGKSPGLTVFGQRHQEHRPSLRPCSLEDVGR